MEDGQTLYGLKPYIYYSCRYKNNDCDVVITYTLDSYITIQGEIGGKIVNESGYLLSGVEYNEAEDKVKYRGIEIKEEKNNQVNEYVYIPGETRKSDGFIPIEMTYETITGATASGQTRCNKKLYI